MLPVGSAQDEPFTSHLPEALFNMSRFLLHSMLTQPPMGISKVYPSVTSCQKPAVDIACM